MTTRTLKTTLALALTTTLGALAPAPAHSAPRNLPEAWDGRALRLGERGFMTTVMFACTDRFETAHGLVLAMQKDKELYKAWLSGRLEAEDCRGFSRGDEVVSTTYQETKSIFTVSSLPDPAIVLGSSVWLSGQKRSRSPARRQRLPGLRRPAAITARAFHERKQLQDRMNLVGPVTAKVCVLAKALRNTRFVKSTAPDPQ